MAIIMLIYLFEQGKGTGERWQHGERDFNGEIWQRCVKFSRLSGHVKRWLNRKYLAGNTRKRAGHPVRYQEHQEAVG